MSEKSRIILPGVVQEIINFPLPEQVQIAVEAADPLYQEIRVENSLTDHYGGEVCLKPGDRVAVTVRAELEATIAEQDAKT
jgi:hypothetical protein